MYKALDIANFFIDMKNSTPEDYTTNLGVNKLVYFAQGCSLARNDRPLFSEQIQAWDLGPVVRSVYDAFSPCGNRPISSVYSKYSSELFNAEDLDLLIDVFNFYGQYTPFALVNLTHEKDTPWREVYEKGKNNVISPESMKSYFIKHPLQSVAYALPANTVGYRDPADGLLVLPADYAD